MELCHDFETFLSHFAITVLLCNTTFSYFHPQSFKGYCIWNKFCGNDEIVQILSMAWALITWQIINAIKIIKEIYNQGLLRNYKKYRTNNWSLVKVFKNGPRKIYGWHPLKNLKGYGLLKQISLGPLFNTFSQLILLNKIRNYTVMKLLNSPFVDSPDEVT